MIVILFGFEAHRIICRRARAIREPQRTLNSNCEFLDIHAIPSLMSCCTTPQTNRNAAARTIETLVSKVLRIWIVGGFLTDGAGQMVGSFIWSCTLDALGRCVVSFRRADWKPTPYAVKIYSNVAKSTISK